MNATRALELFEICVEELLSLFVCLFFWFSFPFCFVLFLFLRIERTGAINCDES